MYKCVNCGGEIIPQNELARALLGAGKQCYCKDCRNPLTGRAVVDGKINYQNYLQTPHWKRLANECRKRANYQCQVCGCIGYPLHAHHRDYSTLGREMAADLIAICEPCHIVISAMQKGMIDIDDLREQLADV